MAAGGPPVIGTAGAADGADPPAGCDSPVSPPTRSAILPLSAGAVFSATGRRVTVSRLWRSLNAAPATRTTTRPMPANMIHRRRFGVPEPCGCGAIGRCTSPRTRGGPAGSTAGRPAPAASRSSGAIGIGSTGEDGGAGSAAGTPDATEASGGAAGGPGRRGVGRRVRSRGAAGASAVLAGSAAGASGSTEAGRGRGTNGGGTGRGGGTGAVAATAGVGVPPAASSASSRSTAWSSATDSRSMSSSGTGGCRVRSWPISALRARS